ncbi:MAG: ABC transporter permease [Planctomycetota bacterium]
MRLTTLVTREISERKSPFLTALMAVGLGVALVVTVRSVMQASEADVARKLDGLGANILVLPPGTAVDDYYSADLGGSVMPESYVARIALSDLKGLDNVSPKLSIPVAFGDAKVTLTGILPQREFAAKATWKGAGVFARPPEGCGPDSETVPAKLPETAVRRRIIDTLAADEVLVGADLSQRYGWKAESEIELGGRQFKVLEILPVTGTVDDSRVFAHLHTVQEIAGAGEVINAIEIVGCCREIAKGLGEGLEKLLPETRVVTVLQIVETQIETNRTMQGLSWLLSGLALLLGGAGILATMLSNLRERRRELGMLSALGAPASLFAKLFMAKALLIALSGGLLGWLLGVGLAAALGPRLAQVMVPLRWDLLPLALLLAVGITALASLWPIWRALHLDPARALRDE